MSSTTSTAKPVAAKPTDRRQGRPIRVDSIKGFSERVRRELDQRSRAAKRR